jgi:hypothetical protein
MNSYRRLETLLDVARAGYWLQLKCPCGHERRLDPMKLFDRLSRRGASTNLSSLQRSLYCKMCERREFTVDHVSGPDEWHYRGRRWSE